MIWRLKKLSSSGREPSFTQHTGTLTPVERTTVSTAKFTVHCITFSALWVEGTGCNGGGKEGKRKESTMERIELFFCCLICRYSMHYRRHFLFLHLFFFCLPPWLNSPTYVGTYSLSHSPFSPHFSSVITVYHVGPNGWTQVWAGDTTDMYYKYYPLKNTKSIETEEEKANQEAAAMTFGHGAWRVYALYCTVLDRTLR